MIEAVAIRPPLSGKKKGKRLKKTVKKIQKQKKTIKKMKEVMTTEKDKKIDNCEDNSRQALILYQEIKNKVQERIEKTEKVKADIEIKKEILMGLEADIVNDVTPNLVEEVKQRSNSWETNTDTSD